MLAKGDRVLVAVSGGADSMLLLNMLISLKDEYKITLAVAHVEHGIRGEESLADAEFVSEFCKSNSIEYHQLNIDAVNESKTAGIGIEEYSRYKRYEFFNSIPCDKIATAHNLTDNIETVLFRLTRGTGLKGVCGIPPVRDNIIRPLIEISSKDIRDYCTANSIPYRIDSSNSDNTYSRNYIRNEALPVLFKQNPNLENAFSLFISDANEDMSFIENSVNDLYNEAVTDKGVLISKIDNAHISLVKRVIFKYFSSKAVTLDRVHLDKVMKLINTPGKCQIKGDTFAVSNDKYLMLKSISPCSISYSFITEILNISEFDKKYVDFYCDYDKIVGRVQVRQRLAGDTISPAGRGCTKTLKKLYNELKIPTDIRESIGVVADDLGVIGIVGYCVDKRVTVDKNTKNIFSVKISSEDLVNE